MASDTPLAGSFDKSATSANCSPGQPPRKPRHQPMLVALVPFAIGILANRQLDVVFVFWLQLGVISFVGWALSFWHAHRRLTHVPLLASLCLMILLAATGGAWHHIRWNWYAHEHVAAYTRAESQRCCLQGKLLSEPRKTIRASHDRNIDPLQSPERTRLTVKVSGIRDERHWQPVSGTMDIIVHAPLDSLRAGDRLQAIGRLVGLSPPSNPGQFDFRSFMRSRGRFATLHVYHVESIQVVQHATHWSATRMLSNVRRRLNAVAWRLIDADEAGFATAILLGNREHLAPDRRAAFLETGTAHLLAISGLHVGILAGSIFWLFRLGLLGRRHCLIGTIVFVLLYAWLVEFRPTVLRAAVLISLYCIGRLAGQRGYSFSLLAVSAWIVLLLNPSDLFGVGPQLSFLAVATLAFCSPWIWWGRDPDPIKRLIARSRPAWQRWLNSVGRGFRATVLASAFIWFFATPLVAYHFHLVAPVGLVLNPLLMLPIALGLYSGAATLLFGWIADWPAATFAWLCEQTLGSIEAAIQLAQALPMSHFWTAGPTYAALISFYAGVLFLAVFPATRLPGRWVFTLGSVWLVFGWLLPSQANYPKIQARGLSEWTDIVPNLAPIQQRNDQRNRLPAPCLTCTFIDVGHGTSVLIQGPCGQNLLYDCGSFGSSKYGAQSISSVLWSENIIHLDAIVLSHADVDHFNAVPILTQRFSIGVVYVSPQMLASDSGSVQQAFNALAEQQIEVRTLTAGCGTKPASGPSDQQFKVMVIGPASSQPGSTDNADSVVIMIESNGRSVVLPGDLEAESLDALLASPSINCDVLMLAHHGSHNSLPGKFVAWSTPRVIVASCGRGRLKEEVSEMFAQTSRHFYRTDQDGAVRVTLGLERTEVQTHGTGRWIRRR